MNCLKKDLKRKIIPQIDYVPKSPIFIDEDKNILFGNSLYEALPEIVECTILKDDFNLLVDIWKLESVLTKEMIIDLDFGYQQLIKMVDTEEGEQGFLFDMENHTEYLTKENYIEPIVFSKGKKEKEKYNEDFFSGS